MSSGHCILRPPVPPLNCGPKLKLGLKRRDTYIESITAVVIDGPKMEGSLKIEGGGS